MKNKGWKILQIIQLIIFLCFSAFLFARTVDGHGTVQTLEVKLMGGFLSWRLSHRVVDLRYCSTL